MVCFPFGSGGANPVPGWMAIARDFKTTSSLPQGFQRRYGEVGNADKSAMMMTRVGQQWEQFDKNDESSMMMRDGWQWQEFDDNDDKSLMTLTIVWWWWWQDFENNYESLTMMMMRVEWWWWQEFDDDDTSLMTTTRVWWRQQEFDDNNDESLTVMMRVWQQRWEFDEDESLMMTMRFWWQWWEFNNNKSLMTTMRGQGWQWLTTTMTRGWQQQCQQQWWQEVNKIVLFKFLVHNFWVALIFASDQPLYLP